MGKPSVVGVALIRTALIGELIANFNRDGCLHDIEKSCSSVTLLTSSGIRTPRGRELYRPNDNNMLMLLTVIWMRVNDRLHRLA